MSERKDLDYYLGLPYTIQLHRSPEGGFVADVVELPGCISQGDTPAEAVEMVLDAMRSWITTALADGDPVPEPAPDAYSGRFVLRIPKSLHRSLAVQAAQEGVSLNQFILYRLAQATAGRREEAAAAG